jgi:hypothetical protein
MIIHLINNTEPLPPLYSDVCDSEKASDPSLTSKSILIISIRLGIIINHNYIVCEQDLNRILLVVERT